MHYDPLKHPAHLPTGVITERITMDFGLLLKEYVVKTKEEIDISILRVSPSQTSLQILFPAHFGAG